MTRALLLLAVLTTACGPVQCGQVAIDILPLDGKPKPAGKIVIKCDGRKLTEINAREAVQ
jgi:hypothetical protein